MRGDSWYRTRGRFGSGEGTFFQDQMHVSSPYLHDLLTLCTPYIEVLDQRWPHTKKHLPTISPFLRISLKSMEATVKHFSLKQDGCSLRSTHGNADTGFRWSKYVYIFFLPQKHVIEVQFLHFWDFTLFEATASTSNCRNGITNPEK